MDPYRMLNQTTGTLEVCTVDDGIATVVVTDAAGLEIERRTVAVAPDPVAEEGAPPDLLALLDRAEDARNAAYDAVMAGGIRTMARLEDADRAGSAAAQAVLNSRGTP